MNDSDKKFPYEDIISLSHHQSSVHPHMSMRDRAAQFAPFAALTGYEEAVSEASRYTEKRIELDENEKQLLNEKLEIADKMSGSGVSFTFTYFVPDIRKSGGAYVEHSGRIKKIDPLEGLVLLMDHTAIIINDIIKIESTVFKDLHFL